MSQYAMTPDLAVYADRSERATFIRRTYLHLAGAILAFVGLEFAVFQTMGVDAVQSFGRVLAGGAGTQLLVLAAFIGVGFLARWWANQGGSPALQYAGLGLYVVFQAAIFVPILGIAIYYAKPTVLPQAAVITLSLFAALTAVAFTTGMDFSFMGRILMIAGFLMLGLCVAGIIFGFNMGLWFSFLGVALAAGYILYDTSNVIHHFRTDQHVAASLELFASLAYLFYHVLRILLIMSSNRE